MAQYYGTGGDLTVTLEGPFGSAGSAVLLRQLSLPAALWKGAVSPFFQSVELADLSIRSKVDLLPSYQQLEMFRQMELALTTQNDGGTLTVYAIGQCPQEDLTLQAAITEVVV